MRNVKEIGFDIIVKAFDENKNPEYINGIIEAIYTISDSDHEEIKPEEPTEEPEEAPKEEEPVKKPAAKKKTTAKKSTGKAGMPKKKLDMGKVGALRKAGWSWEKIGDEFSVSAQTVINHWNAHQEANK